MTRRGQRERNAARRAARAAERRLDSTQGSYVPPERADCVAREWIAPVGDLMAVQLVFRTWRFNGRLADFVVTIESATSGGWREVERFDCCHGHAHLHPDGDGTHSEGIHQLDSIDDISPVFRLVEGLAEDRARTIVTKGNRK